MRRVAFSLSNATAAQLAGTASVVHGPGCLTWHSTLETTGSNPATYEIYDGSTANGVFLAYVSLSSGQSTRDYIGLHCLPFIESLRINVVSGSISGVLIAWVDHVCENVLDHRARVEELEAMAAFQSLTR